MNPFASIKPGIDLRDYPSPEPVDIATNNWLIWGIALVPIVFFMLWLLHRRRRQSAISIDPLVQALQHAVDNNLSTRDRFQTLYSALRSHLANKHDAAWNYLSAEELKTFNFHALPGSDGIENLREQWLQLESLAYNNEEISASQLNAAIGLANKLLQNRK